MSATRCTTRTSSPSPISFTATFARTIAFAITFPWAVCFTSAVTRTITFRCAITFAWTSIISFGIDKAVTYHTDMRLYAAAFVWALNKPLYDGLSANHKKVIDDHCNNDWAARVGQAWGDAEDAGREKLAAMPGHTIVPMSAAQVDVWRKAVAPVYDTWIADANKAGIDGAKALADLRAELKKTGGAY